MMAGCVSAAPTAPAMNGAVLGPGGVEKIRADTTRFYPRYARLGERILRNFVQYLKVYLWNEPFPRLPSPLSQTTIRAAVGVGDADPGARADAAA